MFPHLTVAQNVAFGGREGASALLERFRISHLASARPYELSGGERQRVALARALARRPEGPAARRADGRARRPHTRAVRLELHELLHEIGIPTLLVTHDFEDAAALAARVGVLVDGRLVQLGTPTELVEAPADPFVASFTGGNLVAGQARPGRGRPDRGGAGGRRLVYSTDRRCRPRRSGRLIPWEVSVSREAPADSALNHVTAPISSLVPSGNRVRVRVGPITAEVTAASADVWARAGRDRRSLVQGDRDAAVPLADWPKGGHDFGRLDDDRDLIVLRRARAPRRSPRVIDGYDLADRRRRRRPRP